MKTKGTKRGLAALLVLCMTLFAVPFTAHAATQNPTSLSVNNTWIENTAAPQTVQCGEGTAVYTPASDNEPATLTLTNATITKTYNHWSSNTNYLVYIQGAPLKIVLVGTNEMTTSVSQGNGVLSNNDLEITGGGSLVVNTKGNCVETTEKLTVHNTTLSLTSSDGFILTCSSDVSIQNATVSSTSLISGFYLTRGNLSIENSKITCTVTDKDSYGMKVTSGNLFIKNSEITAASQTGNGIYARNLDISGNSTVTASSERENGIGIYMITSGNIEPAAGKAVKVEIGDSEADKTALAGSPFTSKTDIKSLIGGGSSAKAKYFHSENVDAPTPEAPDERNATITATASIPSPTYTVTIPATVDAGNLTQKADAASDKIKSTTFTVSASSIENLFGAKKVVVSLSAADGVFALKSGDDSLEYAVYNQETGGTALVNNATFTEFTSATSVTGRVDIDQSKITKQGSYTGVMTFSISLADIA